MSDPTGTSGLRRSFLAEANRRVAELRSQTHAILVEHDLMAARSSSLAQFLPNPGDRLPAFLDWFETSAERLLLGDAWWGRFVESAYKSGIAAANGLMVSSARSDMAVPAVYRELAQREFAGIAAALTQQISRAAAGGALARLKPAQLYRAVLDVLRKTAPSRMKAAVNTITVQLHNAGRLATYAAAGISRVGIDAERLEPSRSSRFGRHHDHGDHVHLADLSRIEIARRAREREAYELLAKQRRAAEREQRRSERELGRLRARLASEIERQLAGTKTLETSREIAEAELAAARARAKAEVALAKAQTAVREQRAGAAWQKVITARKVERRALYPKPRPQEGPPQRVPEWVPPPGYEIVGQQAVGTLAEPPFTPQPPGALRLNVRTAGDNRVCDICNGLAADGPYTITEAFGMLPAHPNCRCAFVPVLESEGVTP